MNFSFGEIYMVKFDPSFGREYRGNRPGIVIQDDAISKKSSLVTVLPLTTQLNQKQIDDVFIARDSLNKLSGDSVIKVRNIQSFDKQRFLFKIGRAGSPVSRAVRGYLRRHFGM